MDVNNRKYNSQLEINDLIGDAVANAIARRSSPDAEEEMFPLSNAEAANIVGGQTENIAVAGFKPISFPCDPVVLPTKPICVPPVDPPKQPIKITCPPIIVGLIALPLDNTASLS